MKIGAIAVMPYEMGFLGIKCAKGRGIILPGGTYEPNKDNFYHSTACREALEEVGVIVDQSMMRYICCLPDGGDYMTFAFWCPHYYNEPKPSSEGTPTLASWKNLIDSNFGAYYRVLYEIMEGRYCI